MCLRGEGGQFLLARMDFQQPIVSVMEGEAMALLLGLHWVSSLGLQKKLFSRLIPNLWLLIVYLLRL